MGLSARARLTALYAGLVALGGIVLIAITYVLVAQALAGSGAPADRTYKTVVGRCIQQGLDEGATFEQAKLKCAGKFAKGVKAGASAQAGTTWHHLLIYSALGLVIVTLLAAAAGWVLAGRVLAPVHRITAAARAAGEHDLSQRLDLQGPRDELRELADTFDAMLARLERAFTSQQQFIANASHELRTPLTVMRTAVDVVLAKPEPSAAELTSMAGEVRQGVEHAERLIEALLMLARNERSRARTEEVDLAVVAEDALDGRRPTGVTTTPHLAPAVVTGDALLLERLIANLLDNAERYNVPEGTIEISTRTADATCEVRVVNTGRVVPADSVERLFQPFTRLADRVGHDGFGLGLAIVASIAAVHGGTVRATAPPTGGLDITVLLPRRT